MQNWRDKHPHFYQNVREKKFRKYGRKTVKPTHKKYIYKWKQKIIIIRENIKINFLQKIRSYSEITTISNFPSLNVTSFLFPVPPTKLFLLSFFFWSLWIKNLQNEQNVFAICHHNLCECLVSELTFLSCFSCTISSPSDFEF